MRKVVLLLAGALCVWSSSGCVAGASLTPGQVWARCMSSDYEKDDTCAWKNEICDAYRELLQQEYADAQTCRSACYDVQTHYIRETGAYGCTKIFSYGSSYCAQACTYNYPKDEASPPAQ